MSHSRRKASGQKRRYANGPPWHPVSWMGKSPGRLKPKDEDKLARMSEEIEGLDDNLAEQAAYEWGNEVDDGFETVEYGWDEDQYIALMAVEEYCSDINIQA